MPTTPFLILAAYFFVGYPAAAERGNLIEQRIRVADRAGFIY